VTSQTFNQSLPLEVDANIKKSKSQYQVLTNRRLSFEASNLSKYPIKNLLITINVLTNQEKNKKEDTEKVTEQSIQKKL